MSVNDRHISLSEGKAIAARQAWANLKPFLDSNNTPVLDDRYLEAEHCWMFFRNPQIEVPEWALLGVEWAYVVSKKGTFSKVADFSHDPQQLEAYLKKMSDYFERRDE